MAAELAHTEQDQINRLERFVRRIDFRLKKLNTTSRNFSRARLVIVVASAIITLLVFRNAGSGAAWLAGLGGFAAFIVAAKLHNRVILSIRKHRYYRDIKRAHVARIRRDWSDIPHSSDVEADPAHPFESDLNLFGDRSLHHLIDTSFSREGSERLASWLRRKSVDPQASEAQRSWIRDLVPLSGFRDRISLLSAQVSHNSNSRWEGQILLDWLEKPVDMTLVIRILWILGTLSVITPLLVILHFTAGLGQWWAVSLFVYVAIYILNSRLYSHLFDDAEHLYFQLLLFQPVIEYLEGFRFKQDSSLAKLLDPFQNIEKPASSYLKRATWLSVAASTQGNQVLRVVLNLIMPWELLFSLLLHRYKEALRERLPLWLDALQRLEASCSLATFADLNPNYVFPDLVAKREEGQPIFTGKALGHPLIPEIDNVGNDFSLDGPGDIALITGSNMSGKSTLLRTLGTNMSLAFAGAPVNASYLQSVHFRLFTCINVIDSVNDGISYFYAEVKRLKKLLTELESDSNYPLFFLVDEVFRGTNNRERYIGGRSLLLALSRSTGTGAVSTHDLDLVSLEQDVESIRNYHFREHIEDDRMVFDYQLRSGPCPTTNAIKIMQMEGLPIEPDHQGHDKSSLF